MSSSRRIRTVMYGDQQISATELDLLHTPALQRLYDLHQLGLTDRVYLDASHSRLHHVVGVVEQADRLVKSIAKSLRRERNRAPLKVGSRNSAISLSTTELARYVDSRRSEVRLMGLLHDLTHAPFGHTLEDEIDLIASKHDNPERQADSFYRLLCQYFGWLARDNDLRSPEHRRSLRAGAIAVDTRPSGLMNHWDRPGRLRSGANSDGTEFARFLDAPELFSPPSSTNEVAEVATRLCDSTLRAHRLSNYTGPKGLRTFLRHLHFAMTALLHLELLHKPQDKIRAHHVPAAEPYSFQLLIEQVLSSLGEPLTKTDRFDPHRDAFFLDVIGNTICADLLDYAKRDSFYCGLKLDYDAERIVENFTLVSYKSNERHLPPLHGMTQADPFAGYTLRTSIAIFTHKLRIDVPGQLMGLLQTRFHIYERALFHPTKAVAGAMLGSALKFIGWQSLPPYMRFVGDQVFLHHVAEAAKIFRELLQASLVENNGEPHRPGVLRESILAKISAIPSTGVLVATEQLVHDRLGDDQPQSVKEILADLHAGIELMDRLASRRYHRPIFRLLPQAELGEASPVREDHKGLEAAQIVASLFLGAESRWDVERAIEDQAQLPRGSVVIHCPPYSGPTKVANILLLAMRADGTEMVEPLRHIGKLENGIFKKHEETVTALEAMYRSMWRLVVSVAPPDNANYSELGNVISEVLSSYLVKTKELFYAEGFAVSNDPNMVRELAEAADQLNRAEELESELVAFGDARSDLARDVLLEVARYIPSLQVAVDSGTINGDTSWRSELEALLSTHTVPLSAEQPQRAGLFSEGLDRTRSNGGPPKPDVKTPPLTAKEVGKRLRGYNMLPDHRSSLLANTLPRFVEKVNRGTPEQIREIRQLLSDVTWDESEQLLNQLTIEEAEAKLRAMLKQAKLGPQ